MQAGVETGAVLTLLVCTWFTSLLSYRAHNIDDFVNISYLTTVDSHCEYYLWELESVCRV